MIKIQDVYHSFLDINREDVCEDNEIMMLTSFFGDDYKAKGCQGHAGEMR